MKNVLQTLSIIFFMALTALLLPAKIGAQTMKLEAVGSQEQDQQEILSR